MHCRISIHALLAESDRILSRSIALPMHFYPRSPCGERPPPAPQGESSIKFLSTLSLRRATRRLWLRVLIFDYFYPRSPCGERLAHLTEHLKLHCISIHALLAESDHAPNRHPCPRSNFYPRSPCGERLASKENATQQTNFYPRSPCGERPSAAWTELLILFISIHALLAESDLTDLRH